MDARGRPTSAFERRRAQAPGLMRHGPFPGLDSASRQQAFEPTTPPELLENRITVQAADIEQLARDNRKLATTHVTLKQELIDTQQEVQNLRAQIGSIQTESDIQMRVLMDKIAKMEVDIKAGEGVQKDLQQAHLEAQSLVKARQELSLQIQQATQELHKARIDIKNLPKLHTELDGLREEYQRLRAKFQYEKGLNVDQVEQMQAMEKNLIGMAREVERLRAEVLNAEKRAHALNLYGGPYVTGYGRQYVPYSNDSGPTAVAAAPVGGGMKSDMSYPGHVYWRPHVPINGVGENQTLYGSHNGTATIGVVAGVAVPPSGGGSNSGTPSYPHPAQDGVSHATYPRPRAPMSMNAIGEGKSLSNGSGTTAGMFGGAAVPPAAGGAVREGAYDPSLAGM